MLNQWTQAAVSLSTSAPAGPGPLAVDELGLVQPDGRFHQRVVQGVPDRADGPAIPASTNAVGERQRRVLRPGIGVVHQTRCGEAGISPAAGEQRLLHRRHDQRGRLRHRHPPPQNAPGIDIDDERDVAEPGQRPHVREVRDPPLVRPGRRGPVPLDQVRLPGKWLPAPRRVVVVMCRPRLTPWIPAMAISRATWSRPDRCPAWVIGATSSGSRTVPVLPVQVDHRVDQVPLRAQGVGDRPPRWA